VQLLEVQRYYAIDLSDEHTPEVPLDTPELELAAAS
jgi:hypothetical protein